MAAKAAEGFQAQEHAGPLPGSSLALSALLLGPLGSGRPPRSLLKPLMGKRPRAPRLTQTSRDPSPQPGWRQPSLKPKATDSRFWFVLHCHTSPSQSPHCRHLAPPHGWSWSPQTYPGSWISASGCPLVTGPCLAPAPGRCVGVNTPRASCGGCMNPGSARLGQLWRVPHTLPEARGVCPLHHSVACLLFLSPFPSPSPSFLGSSPK